MNKTNRTYISKVKKVYRLFEKCTPLKYDCGTLCGNCCCGGDDKTGMYLIPGEECFFENKEGFKVLRGKNEEDFSVLVCNGKCNRDERPFACRIYPFFPIKNEKNKIVVLFDPRAVGKCPIYNCEDAIDKNFLKAVEKSGKILKKDQKMSKYIDDITEMVYDIIRLNDVIYK